MNANAKRAADALEGGRVRQGLIAEARTAGRRYRNAVLRGDFASAEHAWRAADHGVGFPYMSEAESAAAESAFVRACRGRP